MSVKEKVLKSVKVEYKKLFDLLNDLRAKVNLSQEKFIEQDNTEAIKKIYLKYEGKVPLTDDEIVQMFSQCGESKDFYDIIKTKKVLFESDLEAEIDEVIFFNKMRFADSKISDTQIVDLIKKDKKISPETIANVLNTTEEYVTKRIASLTKNGTLESRIVKVGIDKQIERTLVKPLEVKPNEDITEVSVKYSYEGPKDSRNRPFCAKMLELDRLYSRKEIESLSLRLGYSVFDRRGGWWTMPDGTHSKSCRHNWQQNVIVKKRKK